MAEKTRTRVSVYMPQAAYVALSKLSKKWGISRTGVLVRLVLESKDAELSVTR